MKNPKMSIDSAYQELQSIVEEFETGKLNLETSIPRFKKGLELAAFLKSELDNLKVEIEQVKNKFSEDKNP